MRPVLEVLVVMSFGLASAWRSRRHSHRSLLLGGETLTDFALALIVGNLVGTYSSVFTAAPLAVAFDRLPSAPVPAGESRTTACDRRRSSRAGSQQPVSPPRMRVQPEPRCPRCNHSGKRTGTAKRKRRRRR
jgi:hypothetical protein